MDSKPRLTVAKMGDSETLRVGEWVIAIGNAMGLSSTVTCGIVSAKSRVVGRGPYDNFIQTDAAINHGNSGGPLFNMKGEVVGINTLIRADSQGIGFAIPINMAKALLPELVEKGRVTRGYIGVTIQDVTEELAKSLGLKNSNGALVNDVVRGDPADKAGVKRGDVIVAFDGKEIRASHDLPSVVAATDRDKEVPLRIVRDGREMTVMLKVGTMKADDAETTASGKKAVPEEMWGLRLQDITPELARILGFKGEGVVVTGVAVGSPAEEAAIERGDIILEVNRQPVKNLEDLKEKMKKQSKKEEWLLLIQRGKANTYIVLKVES